MEAKLETSGLDEKLGEKHADPEQGDVVVTGENVLHRKLQGRHMQMIAM
jgi:amino acid permease